uniref:Pollen-specific leucine-rich repeat extensin-like protein 2 isoform X2 n=1 Tax=Elaeis guineensis var. tenera TaxID=51953 RepID=A0A6I9QL37_ELAGV|nr:pollen-specific leucine-rich repeat extensin-like protein 2 isoform X2 [Elaeis guineensis]
MNSSQFMDKQVTVLSGRSQSGDLFDLMDLQEEHQNNGGVFTVEEILPSYDFQPIRTVGSWPPMNAGLDGASKKMGSSSLRYSGVLEPLEIAKVSHEKERDAYDVARVVEIDRAVKKYADNLLHALEGVSSRLSQLESRTCYLGSSVDELKVSVGNNHRSTNGRLRQIENILREVQTGVQVLRDEQDIAEAQLQLAKLQASKGEQLPGKASIGQPDSWQQVPPPQPVQQPLQTPAAPPQPSPHPSTFVPNAPPPPPPQQNPSSIPYFSQLPQSQMPTVPSPAGEPYLGPPVQPTYTTHQLYQMRVQQSQPPSPQQYQSESQLQQPFSQPIQTDQPPNPSPQLQPTLSHPTEESAPYMSPSQSYPPSICQPAPLTQPSTRSPPTQRFYGPNTSMYEPPASRPSLVPIPYCAAYNIPTGASFSEPYSYSGSPSHYGSCTMKPSPFSSSAASGGSNYQHLPMAEVLPQALPTESSSGGSTGNGVAIDDVVEKLASMGFSRYQVRATVQKLTENGQSVDLNIVLDKLMNDGDIQPQKG